jgi:hypothetical protein
LFFFFLFKVHDLRYVCFYVSVNSSLSFIRYGLTILDFNLRTERTNVYIFFAHLSQTTPCIVL